MPERRNRYCGSKFPHEPHDKPMIGNPGVVYVCRGKVKLERPSDEAMQAGEVNCSCGHRAHGFRIGHKKNAKAWNARPMCECCGTDAFIAWPRGTGFSSQASGVPLKTAREECAAARADTLNQRSKDVEQ